MLGVCFEMGGGNDDVYCCATHREFSNQETTVHSSQSITSSTDIKINWTAAEIREMLTSPQSL